jgi:AcrR family transcriptional regulator
MSKGEETRDRILDRAVSIASRDGLDGLTVGTLAAELGLSKSGLFAHFGSKDSLQVQTLQTAIEKFEHSVLRPALKATRGEPRIRALFERWLEWGRSSDLPGGCVIVTASVELDDKPGPARDFLVIAQKRWFAALSKAAQIAVEAGHFRPDCDPEQFAFELYAIMLGYHHVNRLLHDPKADARIHAAFEHVLSTVRT